MPSSRLFHNRRAAPAAAVILFIFVFTQPCAGIAANTIVGTDVTVPNAVVVSADSIASAVGNQVLLDGGNAIDAAVAVGFALAVTLPRAGNIGGGGFMLIRLSGGQEKFIDYREKAPGGTHRDMFLGKDGEVIEDLSTVGHLAAGVPGTVYGLAYAHEAYGTLPWERLVEPAVRLARKGFVVSPSLARSLDTRRTRLDKFDETRRIFVAPEHRAGDRIIQLDLAATLERIAADWTDFYKGETARLIVEEMRRGGGLITTDDLASYHPVPREPIRFAYRDYSFTAAPLPSSGGVILSQVLQILERRGAAALEWQSAAYVHLVSEAEKIAYRGRALYLGDTDFYPSPWEKMIDPGTIDALAGLISDGKRLKVTALESTDLLESEQTTHFSVVDRWGNAVANTYTLNGSYGSGVVVKGAGFLLNNEMDDFAVKPGHANLYGLVGSEANAVGSGKRMLSSMSPTFVYNGDRLRMVLGSPGGSTIPTAVLQVILNVIDHGMPLPQALAAGRFHEQYLPDCIYIENGALAPGVIDALLEIGHKIQIRKPIGNVQAIFLDGGKLTGASDPRGAGRAVGH
jgi:gamma-glutamyltranspeptidase/glutathione hydrolase